MRVMVSSTLSDMPLYQEQVKNTIEDWGGELLMLEPKSPPSLGNISDAYQLVDRAELYVGIFAHRYGHIFREYGMSLIELEYRRATKQNIPCLILLIDPTYKLANSAEETDLYYERDIYKREKLIFLKTDLIQEHLVKFFSTPEDLATKLRTVLTPFKRREIVTDQQIKLLLIDGDAQSSQETQAVLRKQDDITLLQALSSGNGALELARHLEPDIILVDSALSDAYALIKTLVSLENSPVIIGMAQTAVADTLRNLMISGARDFLLKPLKLEGVEMIRNNFYRRSHITQATPYVGFEPLVAAAEKKKELAQQESLKLAERLRVQYQSAPKPTLRDDEETAPGVTPHFLPDEDTAPPTAPSSPFPEDELEELDAEATTLRLDPEPEYEFEDTETPTVRAQRALELDLDDTAPPDTPAPTLLSDDPDDTAPPNTPIDPAAE